MSLFNAIDLWSTRCGEEETFGVDSLICADLDESGKSKIIVGSLSGLLRIYEVTNVDSQSLSFKPSDLLLETQLSHPIIQVATGQLVSGSRAYHIALAYPKNITVYSFTSIPGSTEHGNQFELKIMYEHSLQRTIFQLIVGPFGGIKGRDFLCSFALDGTLMFFEQETLVHETQLPTFLLPAPMVYVPEVDSFLTLSADWCVESYRYQDLVNTARKKIVPTWSYNLGETVIAIQTVKQNETFIVTLSEHNIICFNSKGVVKFTKRLQYSSLCFHIYINEVTNELMILTVSDSGVLFVYERVTLRWSAKLPIIPISLCRTNIGIKGTLVLLSEQGDLKCCYLGTKPTLFVAPPLENSITSYKNVNLKLEKLQEQIQKFNSNAKSLTLAVNEQEILVTTKILPYDKSLQHCRLVVDLAPSKPLNNVHVTFESSMPFVIKPESYTISSLCDNAVVNATIEIDDFKEMIPTSLEVTTIVSYFGNTAPYMIRKRDNISIRFLLTPCISSDEKNSVKILISTNKPPLPLTVVFQEFRGNQWSESGNNDESACFCLDYNVEKKCLVSLSKLKYGYEFSTNSISLMYLLIKHVILKCKSHKISDTEEKFTFDCAITPKNELMNAVERHVSARSEIRNLQSLLEKLSSQYRLIQRRFLIKLKEKTLTPMTALQTLYADVYRKLLETIRLAEEQQRELILRSNELQTTIDLTLDLISINSSMQANNVEELRSAMALTSLNLDSQGWEERTYANVIHLLKTTLSDSDKDKLLVLPPVEKILNDSTQLWKLLTTAFDRITNGKFSTSQKLEQTRTVSPIVEDEETEEPKERKFRFLKHHRLLSKRQSYKVHDSIIDQLNEIE